MTWAAEWWGRIYRDDAIYSPPPPGEVIPRADFEAMLASGELVKSDEYNGVYQIPSGQYVVILKLPNGDVLVPSAE